MQYETIFPATTVMSGAVSISLGSTGWQRLSSAFYSFVIVGTPGNRLYDMQVLDASNNIVYQHRLDEGAPGASPSVSQVLPSRLLMPPGSTIKVFGSAGIPSVTDTVAANIVSEDA